MTASTISRRELLVNSAGAVIAVAVAGPVRAQIRRPEKAKPAPELRALIRAHQAAYAALVALIRRADGGGRGHDKVDRVEQKALLAVCSYPAIEEADCRAKARYLLAIEARGELDLEEHMQAVLRSMLRRGSA